MRLTTLFLLSMPILFACTDSTSPTAPMPEDTMSETPTSTESLPGNAPLEVVAVELVEPETPPAVTPAADSAPDPIRWCAERDGAAKSCITEVTKRHDLTLLDITAEWCGYCHMLENQVFTDSKFIRETRGMGFVRLDEAVAPRAEERFEVTGYPTLLILDRNGNVLKKIGGYAPTDVLLQRIKEVRDTLH